MSSPADEIPDLERLMRNVIRMAMQAERGDGWVATLSRGVQDAIDGALELATRQRPDEPLRDGWDAAGLGEIAALLRSVWPAAMVHIWPDRDAARVDLERLVAYRGKNLHAVGPPTGQIGDEEIGAMVRRLRVGFEAARRDLLDDHGEWWPYISAVHSNIPEFRFERSNSGLIGLNATLTEGDLVTLDAVGVHPTGDASLLHYLLGGPNIPGEGLGVSVQSGSFAFSVPRLRTVGLNLYVAEDEIKVFDIECVHFQIKVRPRPYSP